MEQQNPQINRIRVIASEVVIEKVLNLEGTRVKWGQHLFKLNNLPTKGQKLTTLSPATLQIYHSTPRTSLPPKQK